MTTNSLHVTHTFGGGWATDFGPSARIALTDASTVEFPFLVDAENVIYELDGGPHKVPGTARLNATELQSGAVVKGLYDLWLTGSGATSTQHRIVYVDTTIKKDDADGNFTNLFTGLTSGGVITFAVLNDLLVMGLDTSDVPKSWDGSTAQNLAGTPPNFAIVVEHKNRMWAAGVNGTASRLFFSALLDPEDWIGSGSGEIDISPDDGDRITGLVSHKDELWIFKGPYKGSIHRITGSAPTGDDPFTRKTHVRGIGAVGHNTIFRFRDDVGFMWSDGSVHALSAVAAFGDFNEIALSRPLQTWLRDHLVFNRLQHAWAANVGDDGRTLITVPIDGATDNNTILMLDYRFDPARWAQWPAFDEGSLAEVVDGTVSNRRILMAGGNDGFVRKHGQATRSIDGITGIFYKVTPPFIDYALPWHMKTITGVSAGIAIKGVGSLGFAWQRDSNPQQSVSLSQTGAGAVLGPAAANEFVLDTSTLAGGAFVERFSEDDVVGEFRQIQYQLTNSVINEDLEIHHIGARIEGAAESLEN